MALRRSRYFSLLLFRFKGLGFRDFAVIERGLLGLRIGAIYRECFETCLHSVENETFTGLGVGRGFRG